MRKNNYQGKKKKYERSKEKLQRKEKRKITKERRKVTKSGRKEIDHLIRLFPLDTKRVNKLKQEEKK